jgi:hypothetical protein
LSKPFINCLIVLEKLLILRDKFVNKHWNFILKLWREVIRQYFNAYISKKLLSLYNMMNILIVKAALKNQKVYGLPWD